MGGCQSTWQELLLTGGIGVGLDKLGLGDDANSAWNAVGFPGKPFSSKSGCDPTKQAVIRSTQEIIATAIVTSLNLCTTFAAIDQQINITCNPILQDPSSVYEGNLACGQCNLNVFDGMLAQHRLERKVWDQGGTVQVRLSIDEEFILLMQRIATCGLVSCKACSLMNVTQANILTQNEGGGQNICYNQVRDVNAFKANLGSLVSQQLLSNQDVLAGVAKAFGTNDTVNITQNIVSYVSSNVDQDFLTLVASSMQSAQTIDIVSATSVFVNNISQSTAFNIALESVTTNQIVEKSFSDQVFQTIEQVANDQNTLSSVGQVLFTSSVTFVSAIHSAVGQVLIAVLVALAVVILAVIGFGIYKLIRNSLQSAIQATKANELQQSNMGALEQF